MLSTEEACELGVAMGDTHRGIHSCHTYAVTQARPHGNACLAGVTANYWLQAHLARARARQPMICCEVVIPAQLVLVRPAAAAHHETAQLLARQNIFAGNQTHVWNTAIAHDTRRKDKRSRSLLQGLPH
jgi:hypothetical protein